MRHQLLNNLLGFMEASEVLVLTRFLNYIIENIYRKLIERCVDTICRFLTIFRQNEKKKKKKANSDTFMCSIVQIQSIMQKMNNTERYASAFALYDIAN